jgi:nucleoid DNA-binding protein
MTKTELIDALAEKSECSKAEAARFIKAFTDIVTDQMQAGEKVNCHGFTPVASLNTKLPMTSILRALTELR